MNVEIGKVQKILDWAKTQIFLDASADNARTRVIKRGQVYHCNFGYGVGSEMQKERPAVIVQIDSANKRSGNTIVVPVTHDDAVLPCMVKLSNYCSDNGNIILNGSVNTSNIMCVSKARLGDFICNLSSGDIRAVEAAMLNSLGLEQRINNLEFQIEEKVQQIDDLTSELEEIKDEMSEVRFVLGIGDDESVVEKLKNE